MQVTCASPPSLSGRLLADVDDSELTCDPAFVTSTAAPTEPPLPSASTAAPPPEEPDIIWTAKPASQPGGGDRDSDDTNQAASPAAPGAAPGPASSLPVQPRPNDDTLIIGIVVGVVAFIAILVAGVCVIRGRSSGGGGGNGVGGRAPSSQYRGGGPGSMGHGGPPTAPGSTCTCVKPPPPPVYYTLPGKPAHLRLTPPHQAPPYFQGPGPGPYYLAYPTEDKDYQ